MSDSARITPTQTFDLSNISRPIVLEPPREPPREGGSKLLTPISIVLGIVISTGTIVGGLGSAFYVDRKEYNTTILREAEDRVTVAESLKRLDASLSRQEDSLKRLSDAVESLKATMSEARTRKR
jgi:hypothetical protein